MVERERVSEGQSVVVLSMHEIDDAGKAKRGAFRVWCRRPGGEGLWMEPIPTPDTRPKPGSRYVTMSIGGPGADWRISNVPQGHLVICEEGWPLFLAGTELNGDVFLGHPEALKPGQVVVLAGTRYVCEIASNASGMVRNASGMVHDPGGICAQWGEARYPGESKPDCIVTSSTVALEAQLTLLCDLYRAAATSGAWRDPKEVPIYTSLVQVSPTDWHVEVYVFEPGQGRGTASLAWTSSDYPGLATCVAKAVQYWTTVLQEQQDQRSTAFERSLALLARARNL